MKKAIAAGHICLDITPIIPEQTTARIQDIFAPGRLLNVGDADVHTGGSVANTGLAMKKLGADVSLIAKTGADSFGDMIRSITDRYDASDGLIRSPGDSTSYSVVIALPGVDRIFLHNPGANATFCADDIPMNLVDDAALFHFGYPPVMKKIYQNNGEQLSLIMRMVHESGCATSMDMCRPDPAAESGRADWKAILAGTLPHVDFFEPSIEELMIMLDKPGFERITAAAAGDDYTDFTDIERDVVPLARECLDMGAAVVLVKCGARGMYYCTADEDRLSRTGKRLELDASAWADKRGFEPAYVPERVLSGTGAGDTSIAAFLTSVLRGNGLEQSARHPPATGACCVSAYDALSGLKSLDEIDRLILSGWKKQL